MEEEEEESVPDVTTVCIDEDVPAVENVQRVSRVSESKSCKDCEYLTENAERAWAMMNSFVQKLAELQTLKNENDQLSRINQEQKTYLASQRQRYQSAGEELAQAQTKIADLEDRFRVTNSQYRQILSKATEAQAANAWRQKYDDSQKLVIELQRRAAEHHKMNVSSMAVAATFSKNYDVVEAKNASMETKICELQKTNDDLQRKVGDLEDRIRVLEETSNGSSSYQKGLRKRRRMSPVGEEMHCDGDDEFAAFITPRSPPRRRRALRPTPGAGDDRSTTSVLPPHQPSSCSSSMVYEDSHSPQQSSMPTAVVERFSLSMHAIFEASFFCEMNLMPMLEPCEEWRDKPLSPTFETTPTKSISLTESVQSTQSMSLKESNSLTESTSAKLSISLTESTPVKESISLAESTPAKLSISLTESVSPRLSISLTESTPAKESISLTESISPKLSISLPHVEKNV